MQSIMRRDTEPGQEPRRALHKHHWAPPAYGATRILLLVGGSFALVLAVIGAILPIMPTTPFILLAAYCYARSSERCRTWLTGNKLFGRYVTPLVDGRGFSKRTKALLVAFSGTMALISAVFLAPNTTVRVITLCIAAGMSTYIVLQGRWRRVEAVREEPTRRR